MMVFVRIRDRRKDGNGHGTGVLSLLSDRRSFLQVVLSQGKGWREEEGPLVGDYVQYKILGKGDGWVDIRRQMPPRRRPLPR